MADQLRAGESPTKSVRRIVRREAAKALKRLDGDDAPPDAAIHNARKRLKRARAALRLVRKSLGARRFQRENEAFRDAARPLSEIRDAKILIEAFDALVEGVPPRDRPALEHVRELLNAHQARVRGRVFQKKAPLKPVVSALKAARNRIDDWPLDHEGWSLVGPGVRRVYRSGRRVFETVRQKAGRRQPARAEKTGQVPLAAARDALSHGAVPDPGPGPAVAPALSDALGDDHDLAVLKQRLARARARLPRTAGAALSRMIAARRGELQAKALVLGARVYDEAPRRFANRLHRRWQHWRS